MCSRVPPVALCCWLACSGCTSQGEQTESEPEPDPNPDSCAANETALPDGSCLFAGMGPEDCAPGFEHDGMVSCEPILPPEACPPGQLAVIGESSCREVSPCGDGTWGDIPVEASTQHVDGTYPGNDSDGTSARPWATIGQAYAAAAPQAIIAVAAGSYVEDLTIQNKPVRLWGRCPSLVEMVGTGQGVGAVTITTGAQGTEVRGLAITGAGAGVVSTGSTDVALEALWVHHTASVGVGTESSLGPTSLRLVGSLVEGNHQMGVLSSGAQITIEGCVVRDTLPIAPDSYNQRYGWGIAINAHPTMGDPAEALVRGCLIERNHAQGMVVDGAGATTVEGCVVRDNRVDHEGIFGEGITAQLNEASGQPATLTVRGCLLERNCQSGLSIHGSSGVVETSLIRHTQPDGHGAFGSGITLQGHPDAGLRGTLTLQSSVIEHNHRTGLFVAGADATVARSVLGSTSTTPAGLYGDGVVVRYDDRWNADSTLVASESRLDH
ncbi:MAG: right-handed parallel beta-helix repeat-containing protein, partial [Deltaproteobacteria bacterium]|nr:right-handed parallel beta-helix repeat-containing protein [Deltaproteobacteria bacterium]